MPKTHFWIVTPSYNQGHFIEETIASIQDQKGDFEVSHLVMDGGSNDETVALLKEHAHLEWVSESDKGQTDAINKGLNRIKEHIQKETNQHHIFAYLNSDDYYLPDALQAVAKAFAQHPKRQWLVGDAVIVNATGATIQEPVRWYKRIWREWLSWSTFLILNPIPQPATFIRWSAIERVGAFDHKLKYVMDYEYWLRLWQAVGRPVVLSQPLAAFRIHEVSKGGSQFVQQFDEQYQIAQKYTDNRVLLSLHSLHNLLITTVYKLIK